MERGFSVYASPEFLPEENVKRVGGRAAALSQCHKGGLVVAQKDVVSESFQRLGQPLRSNLLKCHSHERVCSCRCLLFSIKSADSSNQ
jgi:hypothetical protein